MQKRCNIGFLLTDEHSSYNAAFGLANVLRERGHNPIFLVIERSIFVEYARSHGFDVVRFAPVAEVTTSQKSSGLRLFKRLTEHGPSVLLKQQRLADLINENSIDLFLLDNIRIDLTLSSAVLARMSVPTILVSYTFSSRYRSDCLPIFSSQIPPDEVRPGVGFRIVCTILWLWAICTRGRGTYLLRWSDYLVASLGKLVEQIRNMGFEQEMRRYGWNSVWSEWKRRPDIPEVVFGHRTLDWPLIASNPRRYYFGSTDLCRKEPDFDWSKFDLNKPIVYCSITTAGGVLASGARQESMSIFNRKTNRFLEVVLDCFSHRTDWQLIAACGPFSEKLRARRFPSNIHLFDRAPQLAVLKKADAAITWGGAGTVRECINFGVPMLIFPAWTDQFGNAARVLSRNVGVRGDILNVDARHMTEMVEHVLSDESLRSSVDRMQAQNNVGEEISGLVDFVRFHTGLDL